MAKTRTIFLINIYTCLVYLQKFITATKFAHNFNQISVSMWSFDIANAKNLFSKKNWHNYVFKNFRFFVYIRHKLTFENYFLHYIFKVCHCIEKFILNFIKRTLLLQVKASSMPLFSYEEKQLSNTALRGYFNHCHTLSCLT